MQKASTIQSREVERNRYTNPTPLLYSEATSHRRWRSIRPYTIPRRGKGLASKNLISFFGWCDVNLHDRHDIRLCEISIGACRCRVMNEYARLVGKRFGWSCRFFQTPTSFVVPLTVITNYRLLRLFGSNRSNLKPFPDDVYFYAHHGPVYVQSPELCTSQNYSTRYRTSNVGK